MFSQSRSKIGPHTDRCTRVHTHTHYKLISLSPPQHPAHTCTTTPSAPLMFISGMGAIIACGSVVTKRQSNYFYGCNILRAWRGALWTSVGGKAIKRLRVLKRHSPLNQMKPGQSPLELIGVASLLGRQYGQAGRQLRGRGECPRSPYSISELKITPG